MPPHGGGKEIIMDSLKDRVYIPDCGHNDVDIDYYYKRDEVFGHFAEGGRAYVITRRDTPRDWVQYLSNDKVRSASTNTGKGFLFHANGVYATKYHEVSGNYLPRNLNGDRGLIIETEDGQVHDFFKNAENYSFTVRPGYVVYEGDVEDFHVEFSVFVPLCAPCECINIKVTNTGNDNRAIKLTASQDVQFSEAPKTDLENKEIRVTVSPAHIGLSVLGIFKTENASDMFLEEYDQEYISVYRPAPDYLHCYRESIVNELTLAPKQSSQWVLVSAACTEDSEIAEISAFTSLEVCQKELEAVIAKWDILLGRMTCSIPDKNLEGFLNIWLKNQINLTYRYDRATQLTGYRDGMQDSWGYMLMDPEKAVEKILYLLSCMYEDGRCPRGIHKYGEKHDLDDYCDAPIWIPIAVSAYLKETGNYGFLDKTVGFWKSDKVATVEEHIYRSLDYMYHSRGKNGLILMRDGDWADGLGGINKYGADATSAWVTIAAYNAQSIMADIYRAMGDTDKADEMDRRNAEYKKIVNEVAWDGHWLVYGFFEDGEAIGSHKNLEGKIWLNPQAWGIFSGIIDDKTRIKKISDSVSRYLDTPYGALVMYPPYVFYGERNGRIQKQRPGMFLNSSVYNHAASFKVFSDVKRGDGDAAYDTIMRCIPNHPDNSDTRRTSEPFAIGNVYYGPHHPRYGMNLFTWFTAAPAWLIHGGFEEILGVRSDFNGIKIEPCVPLDWNEYSVSKLYRGTRYNIKFIRSENKGIIVDGTAVDGNIICSDKSLCEVEVRF